MPLISALAALLQWAYGPHAKATGLAKTFQANNTAGGLSVGTTREAGDSTCSTDVETRAASATDSEREQLVAVGTTDITINRSIAGDHTPRDYHEAADPATASGAKHVRAQPYADTV